MMIVETVEFGLTLDLRYYFEILCGLVRAWRPVIESREANPRKATLMAERGHTYCLGIRLESRDSLNNLLDITS